MDSGYLMFTVICGITALCKFGYIYGQATIGDIVFYKNWLELVVDLSETS